MCIARSSATTPTAVAHRALLYDNLDDYAADIAAFLHDGLAVGEPVLVAVPAARHSLIRTLFAASDKVTLLDVTDLGANPARIIPIIQQFIDAQPGLPARYVGELAWPGRTTAEQREITRQEALINIAFAEKPITICCAYNAQLGPAVLANTAATHTHIHRRGQLRPSPDYTGAALAATIAAEPLPEPPTGSATYGFEQLTDLPAVRRQVRDHAVRSGINSERTNDLTVAVNELATNTIQHGGGPGTFRAWYDTDTHVLICEITGPGHITDPLAGHHSPGAGSGGGHGLWLVNQLCDLTELRTGPGGTTIRIHTHGARNAAGQT